jgi:hypothetical protein
MQANLQNAVPVILYSGNPASGSTTVDLIDTYDHVITGIYANVGPSFGTSFLVIEDLDSNFLWGGNMEYAGGSYPERLDLQTFIVCQSLSGLLIKAGAAEAQLSVSGWRLNPSAATLFGS